MHEQFLKDYFENKISITELLDDTIATKVKVGAKETAFHIIPMDSSFELNAKHIIKLLCDILEYRIDPRFLESIALLIEASENIEYAEENNQNKVMIQMLNEWSAPEINYELNFDNIKKCLEKLVRISGVNSGGAY